MDRLGFRIRLFDSYMSKSCFIRYYRCIKKNTKVLTSDIDAYVVSINHSLIKSLPIMFTMLNP